MVRSEMSSPPVGAYRITTYLSEDAIPPVILLNYTFFFPLGVGNTKLREELAPWQRRGVGGWYINVSSAFPRAGAERWLKSKGLCFLFRSLRPFLAPLGSVHPQQVPAWRPKRWRQVPPRAANPTLRQPLLGQELKRKSLQAWTHCSEPRF